MIVDPGDLTPAQFEVLRKLWSFQSWSNEGLYQLYRGIYRAALLDSQRLQELEQINDLFAVARLRGEHQ